MFNWNLRVPYRYGNSYITLRELEAKMLPVYHPEYVRRFLAWLHYKGGKVGAGGLERTFQPDKPGFAPSLQQSFHWLGQVYSDGRVGACAVDTVYEDGPDPGDAHDGIAWREVPQQGSAEARRWGIHANVGSQSTGGESWHIQPIEIDGHGSWVSAGRPAPAMNYPVPHEHDPYYNPFPEGEEEMQYLSKMDRMHDSRPGEDQLDTTVPQTPLKPGVPRKVALGMAHVHGVRLTVVNAKGPGYVSITGTNTMGPPTVNMWDGKTGDGMMFLATPDGHGYVTSTVPCDIIVDVMARG